ncbi:MAG: flippase-like domain-containing protein [Candidatus Zixiibacteriota bacterium]|nr:MAG: flippase-like domain-containing protein [candidate division Zixibacteria bacterium]
MKKWFNVAIGIAVSAFFIYLSFRRVQPAEILYSLKKADYIWIFPNMAIVILTMIIRSVRWRYLLQNIKQFGIKRLFPSVMIGFMANNVLPARLGEFIRAYSLGIKSGESRSSIFATVVIERIFDSLALLAIFWLVIMFVPFPPAVKKFGVITLAFNIFLILFLIFLKQKGKKFIGGLMSFLSFLPARLSERISHILTNFSEGLSIFNRTGILGIVTLWSVILWIITALSNYFIFMAFGMYPNVVASFILLLFVAAGVMLPSAPGFVGVFQAAVVGAFIVMNQLGIMGYHLSPSRIEMTSISIPAFFDMPAMGVGQYIDSLGLSGISKGEALSFSIILWLSQYLPVTLLGLYYLKKEHLSLKKMEI